MPVGLGVDGDGLHAQALAGTDDAQGNHLSDGVSDNGIPVGDKPTLGECYLGTLTKLGADGGTRFDVDDTSQVEKGSARVRHMRIEIPVMNVARRNL